MSSVSRGIEAPGARGALTGALSRSILAIVLVAIAACATPPSEPTAPTTAAQPPQPEVAAVSTAPPEVVVATASVLSPTAAPDMAQADGTPFIIAIDPLQPTVVIDPDDPSARIDLWVRMRSGFAIPDLDSELVVKWEQYYGSRPDYVKRMTDRGSLYLFYVVEELDKRGMPTDLALLPFIESAFNPQAMSRARASGMWQFMPATGKDFDLKQNLFRDDRRDVLASTRAALDYLQMLYGQFGDWQLALAAYNWGQGSVQRAIDRNRKAGLATDYESLRMPDETRNYVPKLQAVKNIVRTPQAYAITLPELENHPYFLSVPITRDIDVDVAARLAGVTLAEFQQLNPQMNRPVILAAGTPQVLLPYANATLFVRNLRAHNSALATWTAWVAPSLLKPADAARMVGMSEEELRQVNGIPPRMRIKAGSTLLVPRAAHRTADVPGQIADNATMALAPEAAPLRRLTFKAGRKGDSVAAVARRYRVSKAQVAEWNSVAPSATFAPGQTIVVMQAPFRKGGTKKATTRMATGKSTVKPTSHGTAKTRRPVAR
jgi:membrane-bound lytic murein transglycosylase D